MRAFWRVIVREPTGLALAGVGFLLCAVVSLVGWGLLGEPARRLRAFTPTVACGNLGHGTPAMYVCASKNGLLTMLAPLELVILLFIVGVPLGLVLSWLMPRLPRTFGLIVAPLVATLMFGLSWAGTYYDKPDAVGLLPVRLFPAVAGLFAYATLRWGPAGLRLLDPLVGLRNRIPVAPRVLAAILIPILAALTLGRGRQPVDAARVQQVTVLIGFVAGYALLAARLPRGQTKGVVAGAPGDDELSLDGAVAPDEVVAPTGALALADG